MNLPSKLIEDAVDAFAQLPGIGRKTALRLVLHLLKQDKETVDHFGSAVTDMRAQIKFCKQCHNVSDQDLCSICSNPSRDNSIICIVETIRDVIAVEQTEQFHGLYHVLGGVISPIDGISPDDLNISSLLERISKEEVNEVVMALSPTIEGDTTIFYLSKKLLEYPLDITTIARGISFGGELQYADEMTLARSIKTRLPYENYLVDRE